MKTVALGLTLLAASLANPALAAVSAYSDKTAFLADSSAALATVPYTAGGGTHTFGSVTFTAAGGSTLDFAEYTVRLTGVDLAISGVENLDVAFTASVQAFGFDFVEPQFDPNIGAAFIDSTFTVTLRQGSTAVGSFTFNAPNDVAAFVGATSTVAFNNVQIRETVGGLENEFFGQFYTAATLPVPEPAGWALWLAGLAGGAAMLRRQRGH